MKAALIRLQSVKNLWLKTALTAPLILIKVSAAPAQYSPPKISKENHRMKRRSINRWSAVVIIMSSLLLATSSFSQRNANPTSNKELPLKELLRLAGQLLSEAKSERPGSDLKLTGYRIEELQLPRSLNVELRGQQVAVDRAWRVTVQGGPFPVRALPAVIWIDDQIVGNGIENESLSQITAITFDSSLIRPGGVISISYGEDKADRRSLAQGIQLKREGGNQ
jgi:hypothetical protein